MSGSTPAAEPAGVETDAVAGSAKAKTSLVAEPTMLLAPVLALVSLVAISVPGWVPIAAKLCAIGWLFLGVVWLVEIARKIAHKRSGRPDPRSFWMLLVLPGFFALVIFSAAAELPSRARFNLSRGEMNDAADAVLQAKDTPGGSRVGSIPVESVETNGLVVWFVTSGFGTPNHWGYVYAPDGPPPNATDGVIVDLGGDWYEFHDGPGSRFPPG